MKRLMNSRPRPRRWVHRPSYPRILVVGAMAATAAFSVSDCDNPGNPGGVAPAPYTLVPSTAAPDPEVPTVEAPTVEALTSEALKAERG